MGAILGPLQWMVSFGFALYKIKKKQVLLKLFTFIYGKRGFKRLIIYSSPLFYFVESHTPGSIKIFAFISKTTSVQSRSKLGSKSTVRFTFCIFVSTAASFKKSYSTGTAKQIFLYLTSRLPIAMIVLFFELRCIENNTVTPEIIFKFKTSH